MRTFPVFYYEPEIDEEFKFGDSYNEYKCVESNIEEQCRCSFCDLDKEVYCSHMVCGGDERKDKTTVYFIKIN